MKIEINNSKIILTMRNRDMERKNKKFIEQELKMLEASKPDEVLEVFAQMGDQTIHHEIEKKHRLITVNDQKLGDLISIECESDNDNFLIDLIPFDCIDFKRLSQGDLYIQTALNNKIKNENYQ
ncbi:MAG: hypothetical protein GF364_14955 [Candidatus Lokiarchaeota archaeon]|nr:hypothetical protein [Candidatus Lokiarchaeota archaeon]